MRRRLDIAASIVVTARVLFLDEPTTGLDPRSRNQVWEIIRAFANGTVIILLGFALGFRPEAGIVGVVSALALVVVFSFALSRLFTTMGLVLRTPTAVMNAGFMSIFPLTFR